MRPSESSRSVRKRGANPFPLTITGSRFNMVFHRLLPQPFSLTRPAFLVSAAASAAAAAAFLFFQDSFFLSPSLTRTHARTPATNQQQQQLEG